MQMRANRSLSTHRWLPQFLVVLLIISPMYLAGQTPATVAPPAASPPTTPAPGTPPQTAQPMAPLPIVRSLKVTALAGNGETNDLERHLMAPLVVQVLDVNGRPVEGAEVVFRFPLDGPSATFRNGNTSQTVRTNGQGQASALNWMSNNQTGTFNVRVTATYGNEQGEATIPMTNATRVIEEGPKSAKHGSWYSSKWFKIALIGGTAATVAGIVLATRGGGGGGSSTPPITITPGSPTVGGPH